MRARRIGAIALAAALGAIGAADAAERSCTKPQADAAEKAIDRVVSWAQLHKAFQDFRQCDNGGVADLYTDAILRLVVEWKSIDTLASAMKGDPEYRDFIYAHLRSPAAKDDQETVYARARRSCPQGLTEFCSAMAEAVAQPSDAPKETKAPPKESKPGG